MTGLRRVLRLTTAGLSRSLELALVLAMAFLLGAVLWGVFTRYVMGDAADWTEEVARYLLMWVALLGAAVAYGRKAHLGLDYFVNKLDARARVLNAVLVNLLVILFASVVLIRGGWVLVFRTLELEQRTPAMNIPMGWVYLAVPISGVFFVVYAVQQTVELIEGGAGVTDEAEPVGEAEPAGVGESVEQEGGR